MIFFIGSIVNSSTLRIKTQNIKLHINFIQLVPSYFFTSTQRTVGKRDILCIQPFKSKRNYVTTLTPFALSAQFQTISLAIFNLGLGFLKPALTSVRNRYFQRHHITTLQIMWRVFVFKATVHEVKRQTEHHLTQNRLEALYLSVCENTDCENSCRRHYSFKILKSNTIKEKS